MKRKSCTFYDQKSIREIMAEITEEQPHYNTLSTIVQSGGFCIAMLLETPTNTILS
jgi:hypothetical protein